jgi:hypothetical protein
MYIQNTQTVTAEMKSRSDEIIESGIRDYYVYGVIRKGEMIYIGMGSGMRFYGSFLERKGDRYLILCHGLPRRLALAEEKRYIEQFQPVDNCHHKSPLLKEHER